MSITQSPNHPNQPNHANHFNHANHPNHTNLIITSITPITPITSITLITNWKFFILHLKNVITSITDGYFSENFWNSWSRQSQLIFLRFFWNTWSRQLRLSFFSQKDLKYVITSNTIHFLWKSPITKSRDYTITKNPKPPIWLAISSLVMASTQFSLMDYNIIYVIDNRNFPWQHYTIILVWWFMQFFWLFSQESWNQRGKVEAFVAQILCLLMMVFALQWIWGPIIEVCKILMSQK